MPPQSKLVSFFLWIALLGPVFIEISGFRTSHLLAQPVWSHVGAQRFGYYVGAFASICLGFGCFCRRYFIPVLLGAILLCSVFAVGPIPVGAVLLFVFSATVLGKLAFGGDVESPLAFLGGIAIWMLAMTFMVRVPINYPATYVALLMLPLVFGFERTRQIAGNWLTLFRPAWVPSLTEFVSLALLALVMVAHWLLVLKPEVSTDALAMHLAVASNIAIHHAFTIDFREFVWALMPLSADWCYSVLYVLGGEYAARLLNLAVLATIGWLIFGVARRFVSNAVALLTVFLFVSTPLVQLVTTSLFIENFVAAMTFGSAVALWKFHDEGRTRSLILTAMLLGTSLAIKLGAAAPVAILLLFLFVAMWRNRHRLHPSIPVQICALAMLIVIGLIPYANAYWQSGNPVFPFENARFHSPYFGSDNLKDGRFIEPLTWRTPALLTFRTSRYFEGQNGSFGLQYLLFLPLISWVLVSMRSFVGRSAAVVGLGGALVFAAGIPNARYFYPALPFLTVAAAASLACLQIRHRRIFQASLLAALVAGIFNTYLLPTSGWYHKDFFSAALFSEAGRQSYARERAPVRELVAYINRVDQVSPVAFTDSSAIAELIPPVDSIHWHDYRFQEQVDARSDPEDLYRFLRERGIRRLIVEPNEVRGLTIKVLLDQCVKPEYSVSGYSVVQVKSACQVTLPSAEPLTAGVYDETDPRLTFFGSWTLMTDLPLAYQKSVKFSNRAGSEVRFKFVGRGFRYSYTGAINRGIAEIMIDGNRSRVVDLYSHYNAWQTQVMVADLSPGLHDATVRATGRQASAATGHFIDVDSIEILGDEQPLNAARFTP